MTYTAIKYKTYADYLESDLGPDRNYRLLSNGEVIELPPEDDSTEIQVHSVGDDRVNRKPDVVVLRPEHIDLMATIKKSTVLFDMPAPPAPVSTCRST